MKTYLKTTEKLYHTGVMAYNHENNTRVYASKDNIEFDFFNTKEDLSENISVFLKVGWEICTREEFNNYYISQNKILNEIIKEL